MTSATKLFSCALLAVALCAATGERPAHAQVILDMSLLGCSDYLSSDPERQELIAAWMSGYYNAAKNQPMVDLKRFRTNKALVEKFCKKHKKDNLMNAIQQVTY